jgi:hypothetical protein
VVFVALLAPARLFAAEAKKTETPSMAGEGSRIKPAAERQLGTKSRPTIKKKAESQADSKRNVRVSLQIPAALRAALARKIDRRIGRNVDEMRKLRTEARLGKFINGSESSAGFGGAARTGELGGKSPTTLPRRVPVGEDPRGSAR